MMDADLPPLPPPLPPTHSRSFSSSSSSSAGSPQPPPSEWARRAVRGSDARNGVSEQPGKQEGEPMYLAPPAREGATSSQSMRSSRSQASLQSSTSNPRDLDFPRSTPTSSRPPLRSTQFSSSSITSSISDSETPHPPRHPDPPFSQQQHTHASSFLSKVSPSLSSNSRYSNSPSNVARLGLRGSPEPLGLGIGSGNFSRVMGGLPSPPPTNSDEGSNEGGSRYGTIRISEEDKAGFRDEVRSDDSGKASPLKPDRPPKSERRSTWTPTKEDVAFSNIDRASPTISLTSSSSTRLPDSSQETEPFRRSASVSSFQRSTSPSLRSSLPPSASLRSIDRHDNGGYVSDAMEELQDGLAGVAPRRKLKARTASSDAEVRLETADAERRRESQSQKANELREKNQRILDSINSQLDPLPLSFASNRGASPSPSSDFNHPTRTVQRSSTSSTIRNLAAAEDDLLQGTLPNFSTYGSTDEDEPRQVGLPRRVDLEEFGMPADSSMRRSAMVGDVSAQDGGFDLDRRARTAGFQSRPRTSLLRQALDDDDTISRQIPLPERSATSMSSYPSTIERIRARRSDLVGSERTRAASSFSDTKQQDQDFSEGMRRLASRELLRTARDRSKSQLEALDSPSPASQSRSNDNASPATLRNRPALPSEFRHSPSSSSISSARVTPRRSLDASSAARLTPSSSSSRDLERFTRSRSAVSSLASPISPSSSSASIAPHHRQARSEVSFEDDYSIEGGESEERETTPKSAKKSTFDRIGSVGRARTSLSHVERRKNSVSELLDRPHSRMSREGRRNAGVKSPDTPSRGTATPPPPSSARSEDRYSTSGDLAARKERLRNTEVGSEAWMAELDNLRHRGTRSRASDIDGRSTAGDHPARSPSEAERDRTVRAINALLAGQGIVATAVNPTSPASSTFSKDPSPRKRESIGGYDRNRKISFANGTREDSQLPPGSGSMSRSNSNTSRNGSEPLLQGLASQSSSIGDHHKLLLSAFDHFDRHFSQDGDKTPESIELVKRMVVLISSTSKLNTGLRSLAEAIKEEQVQAELDEDQRNSTVSLSRFEKSIHALLRTSDDQVRSLSEDLIAITRVDRERERLRKEQEGGATTSRPLSRANDLIQSPPKRPTTAGSVLEGATVSLSTSRSPNVPREVLRNPLEDPSDSFPASSVRNAFNFSGRSPFAAIGTDSPTPASRRAGSTSETPLRRGSISTSSTYSSATGTSRTFDSGARFSNRRGKSSDPTRSPTQSGAVPFPTATSSVPIPRVDSTPALSNDSPTRNAYAFPRRPVDGPPRTYSGASGDAIIYEAIQMAANMDEARIRTEREVALERLETARSQSPIDERRSIISATPTSDSKRPRTRSSMGAIGSALKNAFTPKKKGLPSPASISRAYVAAFLRNESATNDTNLFWAPQFGLITERGAPGADRNEWLLGLVNGAPYLCCAVIGCWLTAPLNNWLGRRGTIFLTATLSALTCIWSGCTNSWEHLFAARFVLGLGIGPKSATVPVYGAETAPPLIRGALVMQWQVWTASDIARINVDRS
ncbi:hypothetical protein JCM5350_002929 [Sporobolomyces pararoseus]